MAIYKILFIFHIQYDHSATQDPIDSSNFFSAAFCFDRFYRLEIRYSLLFIDRSSLRNSNYPNGRYLPVMVFFSFRMFQNASNSLDFCFQALKLLRYRTTGRRSLILFSLSNFCILSLVFSIVFYLFFYFLFFSFEDKIFQKMSQ